MTIRHPYFDTGGAVAAMAHRGFSLDGLENSMAAFQQAVDLGYRYLETDAHGTSDGIAVALHDPELDRTTDATGAVADLEWATVKRARIGGVEPVPLLEDVLATWPEVRLNIDVKGESGIAPVVEAIERTRAHDRVCVTSFSTQRRVATVAALSRPVATSGATRESAAFWAGARIGPWARRALRDIDVLQVPWRAKGVQVLWPHHVAAAHRHGRQVHVWTVNDPEHMETLLDMGVDGLISDRADLLKRVLVARGQWYSGT